MGKSCLSVGLAVSEMLGGLSLGDGTAVDVYPVLQVDGRLPCVCYHVDDISHTATKSGSGADKVLVSVSCYASQYGASVELAEIVRERMEYVSGAFAGLLVRHCVFKTARDGWNDDAYSQELVFEIGV